MAYELAMGAGMTAAQPPAAWLAATGGMVAARVRRLAEPPTPARWVGHGLALAGLTVATAAVSALVLTFAVTGVWLSRGRIHG
jgi:hypothetical protein